MPAIRAFSLYAAVAVLVNFLLQITVFVGVMMLDVRRQMVMDYFLILLQQLSTVSDSIHNF